MVMNSSFLTMLSAFFIRAVPSAVFSQPPIGQVGISEEQVLHIVKCRCNMSSLPFGAHYFKDFCRL